jgi:hypothetical protein
MTRHLVSFPRPPQLRIFLAAPVKDIGAAGVKIAAVGGMNDAGDIPLENDAFLECFGIGFRGRNGGHESLGVWMKGILIEIIPSR